MSKAEKNKVNLETQYQRIHDYFPFPSMRNGQEQLLDFLRKNLDNPDIKYILVEAGTGMGKSALALAAAGAAQSAYVATANKFLQDQYIRDFSSIMVDLKGRGNYRCNCYDVPDDLKSEYGEYYTCENSPCRNSVETRSECNKNRACEYHKRLFQAAKSPITCFNFASALAFLNYLPSYFSSRNLLVCDECHNIPNWITNFVGIEISKRNLKELELKEKIPDFEEIENYAIFIAEIQSKVNMLLESEEVLDAKLVVKLENFQKKLALFDTLTNDKENLENFIFEKKIGRA